MVSGWGCACVYMCVLTHMPSHAHDVANEQLRDGVSRNEQSHPRGNTTPWVTGGSSWAARHGGVASSANGSGLSLGCPPHLLTKAKEVSLLVKQGSFSGIWATVRGCPPA